jgi:hypothetical protein
VFVDYKNVVDLDHRVAVICGRCVVEKVVELMNNVFREFAVFGERECLLNIEVFVWVFHKLDFLGLERFYTL